MTIGESIKMARKKAGLTQKALADKLGIPYQGISQYERGVRNPKLETLDRIAEALGVDTYTLISCALTDEEVEKKMEEYEKAYSAFVNGYFSSLGLGYGSTDDPYYPSEQEEQEAYNLFHKNDEIQLFGLNQKSVQLINAFESMNEIGKNRAIETISDLAKIPEYQKRPPQSPKKALYTSTGDKPQEEAETPQNEPQGQKDGPKQEPEEQ